MSQSDKPKGATSRKGTSKTPSPVKDLESRIAELMQARDAAQKQAIDRHNEFQAVSRRVGELEAQVGELDEQLKKARAEAGRAAENEKRVFALQEQLEHSGRALSELRAERTKLLEQKDAAERDAAALRTQVADLKRHVEQSGAARSHADDNRRALDVAKLELKGANYERHRLEGEVKRLQEEKDASERAAAALRMESAELRKQAAQSGGLRQELEEARRQLEETRHRYEEAREDRLRLHQDVQKLQDLRDAEERELAALRARMAAAEQSERRLAEATAELRKQQELREAAASEISALKKELEDRSRQVSEAKAKTEEANRYFTSLEKELIEARAGEADLNRLHEEVARLESTCHEQQGFLDELGQTVMELELKLQEAEAVKAAAPPPPAPPPVAEAPAKAVPPAPAPAAAKPSIFDPEPPPPPAAPAPAPPPAAELPLPESILPAIPPMQSTPSSNETTLRPQHLFGPDAPDGKPAFILHELLPPDAMGVIYRASERATGRQFAVRFMAGQAGEEQTQAIEREVEKLIALPHPNILHVQGSGRRKNRLYLAMDLVQAPSLSRAKIHDLRKVVAILREAAGAVHYAHEEKIFHGDLNPDNILIAKGEDGEHPLVKDFEIAFMLETLVPPSTPKDARPSLRNVAFLPPEQTRTLGVAIDVYGLGATLYGALAGKAPFEGKDAAAIRRKVMFEDPPALPKVRPDVPEALAAIVRRAMVKESGLRYPTAQAFADALGKFLDAAK